LSLDSTGFYLALLAMGFVIYGTRLAGFWLLQNYRIEGRAKAAIDAVPPAILTAVIAPAVFLQGPSELIGGAVTITSAMLRLPLLVTICLGVGSVALLRAFL
jgi:uncharacterized membrane protein